MKKDIKEKINTIKDELNNMIINSEVIENYTKLTCDKLDQLDQLDIQQDRDTLLCSLWDLKRYSECYLTLNNSIMQEISKLNGSTKSVYSLLNDLLKACDDNTKK